MAGNTPVTITGTNFVSGGTQVYFGSMPAIDTLLNNATQIIATAPAGTGTVDITFTTADGTSAVSANSKYTYVPLPTLSINNPSQAEGNTGTSSMTFTVTLSATSTSTVTVNYATINGSATTTDADYIATSGTLTFTPGVTSLTFDVSIVGDTQVEPDETFTVILADPTGATLGADRGTGTILNDDIAAPTVTGVSPSGGSIAGGTSVTITGTNLTGATSVTFGGTAGTGLTLNNSTSVTVTTPAYVAGAVNAVVTTPGGTSAISAADQFTYVAPPVANAGSVTVTHGSINNTIPLNITGAATSVAVSTGAAHGTATASGTTISYTPSAGYAGPDSFAYTATNAAGTSSPATVTITVSNASISYSPTNPLRGTMGVAYSQSLTGASGGTAPYIYTIASNRLPAGLTLANGTLSGTPTESGTFNFTVSAKDSSTGTGPFSATSATLSLTVAPPTISVSPGTLTTPPVYNQAYSQTLSASGGTAPYTYAVTVGSLPAGLSLSSDGVISGTPTGSGPYNFTVTAKDSSTGAGAPYIGTQTYSVTIGAPHITVTPATLSGATTGVPYTQTFSASGGAAPYTFSTSDVLPTWLTLNPATRTMSGTPNTAGSVHFTITATDVNGETVPQPYTLTVSSHAPVAGAVTHAVAANSSANSIPLALSGGTPSSVNVASAPNHGTTSINGISISYTPTAGYSGPDSFTYTAIGRGGTSPAATVSINVTAPTLAIAPATATLPAATLQSAYSQTLGTSGGTAPYSYAVTAGALPAGLTLSSGGTLSGTPTAVVHSSFTITATDAHSATGSRSYALQVQVATPTAPAVAVSTAANQSVTINAIANATGAPFTGLAVQSQPASGTVSVQGMNLVYTPAASTQGAISFAYTLANAAGTSLPIAVTVQVAARPDPTANADVRGLNTAQQQATVRFAGAQLMNFSQRLEQLRNPNRQAFHNGLQLAMPRAGNNSIRNCQNVPSMLGQQDCIARQGMDSRTSLASNGNRASLGAQGSTGLTAEQAYASRLDSEDANAPATLGSAQRNLAQRAVALGAGSPGRTTRVNADEPLPAPGSAERPRLAYWTAGMLDWGFADASKGQDDGLRFTTSGVTMGLDYLVNAQWTVGMGMGFAYDRTTIGSEGSRNHSKGVSTALYGSWNPAPAYFVDGVLGYSRLRFDSRRWVADAGAFAEGQRNGTQWFASVSAGYEWRTQQMMLSPYGRLQWARSHLDAYTETGAGWHALQFGAQRISSSSASLGLRGETSHITRWGQLLPFGRLELQHDFDGQSDMRIAYADLGGSQGYAISNDPIGRNRVQIGMGSRLQSRIGTFAAELQFTRSNTSFQRGLRLSYTTRY